MKDTSIFRKLLAFIPLAALAASMNAQIYMAKDCEISFFSATPVENIQALNKAAKPILNAGTGDIQVRISIQGFVFPKPLMQEHFNENYLESDKKPTEVNGVKVDYAYAFYRGKINEKVDYTIDGVTKVTVTGKITIHGVEKDKNLEGTVTVKGGQVLLDTKFNLHVADYNIKIPSLVVKNIAEDVEVKMNATLEPYKK